MFFVMWQSVRVFGGRGANWCAVCNIRIGRRSILGLFGMLLIGRLLRSGLNERKGHLLCKLSCGVRPKGEMNRCQVSCI